MSTEGKKLSHVAGTFLIQADGAFLNGAGLDRTRENRNTTVPKSYRDGVGNRVPYVSAQAWRRWLRNTMIEETGWPASELRAIDLSEKGTTNKIATELNPIDFAEDDIFGYMRAAKGQGRETAGTADEERTDEEADRDATVKFFKEISAAFKAVQSGKVTEGKGKTKKEKKLSDEDRINRGAEVVRTLQKEAEKRLGEDEDAIEEAVTAQIEAMAAAFGNANQANLKELIARLGKLIEEFNPGRLKALMRPSPFAASLLVSVRRRGWEGMDEGFVHLKEGTPLPYSTEFYNTHLQGVFCLDYGRLGVFWNIGDRIELDEDKAERFLKGNGPKLRIAEDKGKLGRIYELTNAAASRKERAGALLNALAVLRGGAKQAQFGTDVAPKVLVMAGLTCGNPIFNQLFQDDSAAPLFKVEAFKEIIRDYADRIVSSVLIGIRRDYLKNDVDVRGLAGWWKVDQEKSAVEGPKEQKGDSGSWVQVKVGTPIDATKSMAALLP
jgi:CRISPR-associated protein Cas7/Cst2/DevR subtype I-B